MGKRHRVQPGVATRATLDVCGLIKRQGSSEYAPISQEKVCRVELEVEDMDVTVLAYGDLADVLAGFPAATAIRAVGELHIARWDTGDGQLHQRMGVRVRELNDIAP